MEEFTEILFYTVKILKSDGTKGKKIMNSVIRTILCTILCTKLWNIVGKVTLVTGLEQNYATALASIRKLLQAQVSNSDYLLKEFNGDKIFQN